MRSTEQPEPELRQRGAAAVLARAAGAGSAVGGALGGLVVLTTAVADRDLTGIGVPALFAVIVGGLVGLVTAAPTSLVWMLLAGRTSATPTTARWVASGAAAAIVLVIDGVLTRSLDWFAAGCAAGSGLVAYLAGPRVGYRRVTGVPARPHSRRT